jgi:hypothetical protein
MIKQIIELLKVDKFYGISETIDFAKGKYKIEDSILKMYEQKKRVYKLKNKAE